MGLPVRKDSLAKYIEFAKMENNYLQIKNTSNSHIIVEIQYSNGGQFAFPLNSDSHIAINNLEQKDIHSYFTYLIDRPKTFKEKIEDILAWIARIVCLILGVGFIILFYHEIQEKKRNGKPTDKGGAYILLSIGIVLTIISITFIIDYFLHTNFTLSLFIIMLGGVGLFYSIDSIKGGEYGEGIPLLILDIIVCASGIFILFA